MKVYLHKKIDSRSIFAVLFFFARGMDWLIVGFAARKYESEAMMGLSKCNVGGATCRPSEQKFRVYNSKPISPNLYFFLPAAICSSK